jgi:hypothetical protein|tara:strand:- start:1230 stop:1475 length:246 start_codon:yes stop_codon:yes gene_type:complete
VPDPSLRNKLNDIELVEYAQTLSRSSDRTLRYIKDDSRTDGAFYEDMSSGDRHSVPQKFIKSIGLEAAFELVALDPNQSLT